MQYLCKYAPVELWAGFGETCLPYVPQEVGKCGLIHDNICSFGRALLPAILASDEPFIITDCCDSMRRLYDVAGQQGKDLFWLQLPHKQAECSIELYKNELLQLITKYREYSGSNFNVEHFRAAFKEVSSLPENYIAVLGARLPDWLMDGLEQLLPLPVVDLTCNGRRHLSFPPQTDDLEQLMTWYARELLSQTACMRMSNVISRRQLINDPRISAVIYHTVKFCDFYGFEYASLRSHLSMPLLHLESDWSQGNWGQVSTRISALAELLKMHKPLAKEQTMKNEKIYALGIDIGSTSTNVVILDEDKRQLAAIVKPTGINGAASAEKALELALQKAGLTKEQITSTVTTGYGRSNISFRDDEVTEITCHAYGARFLDPEVRTIIDIGGQDSKVICLDDQGQVLNFVMNDKCAAGTGRFLEMMANCLGLTLAELATSGEKWQEEITISSMCSVFAESEVISLLAANKRLEDVVHGINHSVASKIVSLSQRLPHQGAYMMTGGVAQNSSVVDEISKALGAPIRVPRAPQICGALGAALIAINNCQRSK